MQRFSLEVKLTKTRAVCSPGGPASASAGASSIFLQNIFLLKEVLLLPKASRRRHLLFVTVKIEDPGDFSMDTEFVSGRHILQTPAFGLRALCAPQQEGGPCGPTPVQSHLHSPPLQWRAPGGAFVFPGL